MIAVTLALELLLMTMVGFFARKRGIVNETFAGQLTSFVMRIILPMLIFHSIRGSVEFTAEALRDCGIAVAAGFLVMLFSLGTGQLLWKMTGKGGDGRIIRYAAAFTHFSFMGIPVVEALFGGTGTMYYAFFITPVRIFYYALSEPLMTPPVEKTEADSDSADVPAAPQETESDAAEVSAAPQETEAAAKDIRAGEQKSSAGKQLLKKTLTNPALIAVALGILFWVTGWKIPAVPDYVIRQCAAMSSPLGLILCGLTLGNYDLKALFTFDNLKIPFIRLVVLPAAALAVVMPVTRLCGLNPMLGQIIIIYMALPAASLLPAYAMRYDPDEKNHFLAAGASVLSTLFSLATLPVWYMVLTAGWM